MLFFFSNKKIISIPNASASIDAEMRAEITLFTEVDDDVDVGDIEFDFKCIKIKVGAIDFEEEIELLRYIRNKFPADVIDCRFHVTLTLLYLK